ncbi:DUF1476 domain-containing protein [uncultured Cohaesibacter sp.]|uniref:DUF1476 domain-containing protein n=1 Tax=uncultured Cohaesibacter sp. TaxID=1002546 RepID=UPI00292E7D7D|nr:DUF1476 domain-containing protein [uncultured Cohaesibacter sp.]
MTIFDKRRAGFEAKFVRDQEALFRATARRNKLVGHWAAQKLGYVDDDAEQYAQEAVKSAFQPAGDEQLVGKISNDFNKYRVETPRRRIRQKLREMMNVALRQLASNQ